MARGVSLPAPTTSPFGQGIGGFGQYDVLDTGQQDRRKFDRAQAAWHAGKISNEAYLAAYADLVASLPQGSSERINAQDSLTQARYTFARNRIVSQVDGGSEEAWEDLLAFDRRSLAGLNRGSDEYQRRLGYLRSTQGNLFGLRYQRVLDRFQAQKMTQRQVWLWLRAQQGGPLTDGNPALARDMRTRIDDAARGLADEERQRMYDDWQADRITPEAFVNYARIQLRGFVRGTDQYKAWHGYIDQARDAARESRMSYRWALSKQYHDNQLLLATPPPGGAAGKSRTIFRDGSWVEVPVAEAPTPDDTSSFEAWKERQTLVAREQKQLLRRLDAVGGDFVAPEDMAGYYSKRQSRLAPGSSEWLRLQAIVDGFTDEGQVWKVMRPENGWFPTQTYEAPRTAGRRIPGEQDIGVGAFMKAMAGAYNSSSSAAGKGQTMGKFGIAPQAWRQWASEVLGDASARMTPENEEKVVRSRLHDLHQQYGSWALVAYAWTNGSVQSNVSEWAPDSVAFVNRIWQGLGLGRVPGEWRFDPSKYRILGDQASSMLGFNGYDVPASPGGFGGTGAFPPGDGWGYRTDIGGGANLTDASFGASGYGVKLSDRNVSWEDLKKALQAGHSAVAMGLMAAVQGTGLDRWDRNFAAKGTDSRHGVHIIRYKDGKVFWQDPLAPPGRFNGEWVDESYVKAYLKGYSGTLSEVGVALSPKAVDRIPRLVSEHEPGPWTGCVWASAAMLVNAALGANVATMDQIRTWGESATTGGTVFNIPQGPRCEGVDVEGPRPTKRGASRSDGGRVPASAPGKPPTTPGPQPGPATFQWSGEASTGTIGNPRLGGAPTVASDETPTLYETQRVGSRRGGITTRLIATDTLKGIGASDYENLYSAARRAFLDGQTTFVYRAADGSLLNIYVPPDPTKRLDQMRGLDDLNIELAEYRWRRASEVVTAAGDGVTETQLASEADARERHTASVQDAGENMIAMLFTQQPAGQGEGAVNVNPGADMERIGTQAEAEARKHLERAALLWENGQATAARSELQAAQDITDGATVTLSKLAEQVQQGVKEVQKAGVAPTDEQATAIEETVTFETTYGFDKIGVEGGAIGTELERYYERTVTGDWLLGPDGKMVRKKGVELLVRQSESGGDDQIVHVIPHDAGVDMVNGKPVARTDMGTVVPNVSLAVEGGIVLAHVPYVVDTVGYIQTPSGSSFPIVGKIVTVTLGGKRQVAYEQPFQPGRWVTSDEGPPAIIYKGPDDLLETPQADGSTQLSWGAGNGRTWTLAWNQRNGAYDIVETQAPDWFGNQAEPVNRGSLATNASDREAMASMFTRDLTGVSTGQRAAADQVGLTLGFSAQQFGEHLAKQATQAVRDRFAKLRAQSQAAALAPHRGRGLPPYGGLGTTPFAVGPFGQYIAPKKAPEVMPLPLPPEQQQPTTTQAAPRQGTQGTTGGVKVRQPKPPAPKGTNPYATMPKVTQPKTTQPKLDPWAGGSTQRL